MVGECPGSPGFFGPHLYKTLTIADKFLQNFQIGGLTPHLEKVILWYVDAP